MNERANIGDPYELALHFWRLLGPADRCRLADQIEEELGPTAPIPQTEDIRADAKWWMQAHTEKVRRTYLIALFDYLPRDRQDQFIAWAQKNRKDVPVD